jgi:FkbM family methyltransferase
MEFKHLMEVGCDGKASLHKFLTPDNRLDVIECNPNHLFEVNRHYANLPNVKIHPYAMWHEKGIVQFNLEGASSYVEGVTSPCMVNDGIYPESRPDDWRIQVEARTFDEFDDGTIDIMDLDIEGAEWYVIQKMISRPKCIIVEMEWDKYVNPFYNEINQWMTENLYYKFNQEGACTFFHRLV